MDYENVFYTDGGGYVDGRNATATDASDRRDPAPADGLCPACRAAWRDDSAAVSVPVSAAVGLLRAGDDAADAGRAIR